jgi:hypothetical protein
VSVEIRLDFLIKASGITQPRADRRLNAIENQIAGMTRAWRDVWVIHPGTEIRMSRTTHDAMVTWVEAVRCAEGDARERLAAYSDPLTRDESVPSGWIRILV